MGSGDSKPCPGWGSPCYGGKASKHSTSPDSLSIQSPPPDWSEEYLVPHNSPAHEKGKGIIKYDSSSSDSGSSSPYAPYGHHPECVPNMFDPNRSGPSRYWSQFASSDEDLRPSSFQNYSPHCGTSDSSYGHNPNDSYSTPYSPHSNGSGPSSYYGSSPNQIPSPPYNYDYYPPPPSSSNSSNSNGSGSSHQSPPPYYDPSPNQSPPYNNYYPPVPGAQVPETDNYNNSLAHHIFGRYR